MLTPRALELWNKVRRAEAPALVNRRADSADLVLYGIVGVDFTDQTVSSALTELQGLPTVNVYVNSPGGSFFQGKAMYAQLSRFAKDHTVKGVVDGIAASAASFVLMACPKIEMNPEATMMIHEVHAEASGRASDLEAQAKLVRAENENLIAIYAKRTGLEAKAIASMLDAETWLSASEAVANHFADSVVGDGAPTNQRQERLRALRLNSLRACVRTARPAGA